MSTDTETPEAKVDPILTRAIRQELKARMTGLEARRTHLAALIRRGDELREVEVLTRAHYASGTASEVRTDTGEVLLARPLTEKKRQPSLLTVVEAAVAVVADGTAPAS